jgi:hypothetical protein
LIGLKTSELLLELAKYNFYDWDNERDSDDKYFFYFGMSQEVVNNIGIPNFYHSWGYDAVQNPHADPSFSPQQWLTFEQTFFRWLKGANKILFPNAKCLVTPELERWWFPYDSYPPKWTKRNKWEKSEYDDYVKLLYEADVIRQGPNLRYNYRGAIVQSYHEFETLGKISARNKPLLFFIKDDRVIQITEYLTIMVEFKNKEDCEHTRKEIVEAISPQFF